MLKTGCLIDSEGSNEVKKERDFRDEHIEKPEIISNALKQKVRIEIIKNKKI